MPDDEWKARGKLAQMRRLYHHVVHGGTLGDEALKRTNGEKSPEAIARIIVRMETECDSAAGPPSA